MVWYLKKNCRHFRVSPFDLLAKENIFLLQTDLLFEIKTEILCSKIIHYSEKLKMTHRVVGFRKKKLSKVSLLDSF